MIPPGGEGEIKVTLTAKAGTHADIHKQIMVVSDDPETPEFALTMKGELFLDVSADPTFLTMRDVRVGKTASAPFTLTITEPDKTEITEVVLEDDTHFELRHVEGLTYEVHFRGSPTVGSYATRVEATTTAESMPEVQIPVRAFVVSNLRYGKHLRFMHKDGVIPMRRIRISARQGDAPKIAKIKDPLGLLDVKIGEPAGPHVDIEATVDMEKFAELSDHQQRSGHPLLVFTNDPDEPKIEITYMVREVQAKSARAVPGTATVDATGPGPGPGTQSGSAVPDGPTR